jgi:hypothetical protein
VIQTTLPGVGSAPDDCSLLSRRDVESRPQFDHLFEIEEISDDISRTR